VPCCQVITLLFWDLGLRKFSPVLFLPLLAFVAQSASFTNGQAARAVIGQNLFTDAFAPPVASNNVQPAVANVLGGASGLAYFNGTLYVADANRLGALPQNNRILGFSTTQIPGPQADVSTAAHPSASCWLCGYGPFVVVGQQDYTTTLAGRNNLPSSSSGSLNTPTAVATDGRIFAVADTDNNRVLVWNTPPANQTTPPNVVLGQANFTAFASPQPVNANSLRGPQGVWIANGKLFVADTQNHRVLIWNSIPTQNNQAADLVLGQPNFSTANQPPVARDNPTTAANQLLNPVSVTSDGTHLFVADLGFNRVLIWNSIPTSMDQGADVVVGQPLMTTSVPNWNVALCGSNAVSANGQRLPCEATLNFPRFALSDGARLFIADGGNDRVLIFNHIPTTNGEKADTVLGQPDFTSNIVTFQTPSIASTAIDNTSSVDTTPSPASLAFDGANLYVSDPYNRRVLLFTPGDEPLPSNSVVNWASEIVRQEGVVTVSLTSGGTITANDTVTVTIAGKAYTYTVKANDTLDVIAQGLVSAINANGGDPNATALFSGTGTGSLYLSSKTPNLPFDAISLAASASNTANLTVATSGGYLSAGTAATASPGMLIEINGTNLADQLASINLQTNTDTLPTTLGGVQVFIDGLASPLVKVSPTQIVTQIPFSVAGQPYSNRNSTSIYVRTQRADGSITTSNATPAYIAPANPGLFSQNQSGTPPFPAAGAKHQRGNPSAVVSIDGSIKAGDTATITVNGTNYTYTVQTSDTLGSIVSGLVNLINADANAVVTASAGGAFNRVVVTAKASGAAGTGISVSGSTSSGAQVSVTAYTGSTCCNVTPDSDITPDNPAVVGETIQIAAAGLGLLPDPNAAVAGQPYNGSETSSATNSVSATMNGVTAQVVTAGFRTGAYGIYTVQLIVPSNLPNNNATQLYIAQNAFVSNIVTVPVGPAVQVVTPAPTPTPTPAPVSPGAGLANAQVLVNPTNLVFATQTAGSITTNATQAVTISNPSTANLNFSGLQITGANASDFAVTSNTCPASLPPSSSCSVTVTYTPVPGSIRTASLVVSDSAAGSPQTVALTGVVASQFEIVNKFSGKVLDVPGFSTANGTPIWQWNYLSGANQKWSLVDVGNGAYAIMNLFSGKVLDVLGFSTANGATVWQWDYLGGDNQKWVLTPVGDSYYKITNVLSGKVLDVPGGFLANGTFIWQWDYLGGDNQKWVLTPVGDSYYKITNVLSGKVLDVPGGFLANGTFIWQWDYLGGDNQKWQITNLQAYEIVSLGTNGVLDVPGGFSDNGIPIWQWQFLNGANQKWYLMPVDGTYYQIVNAATGKVLDVTDDSNANTAKIQQYDYQSGPNQQWALLPVGTDVYAIVNRKSGRILDIPGGSTANGTIIQQYDYFGYANQLWRLIPVGAPGQ
jgi:uncharacterized protein (TIGR03437 family)